MRTHFIQTHHVSLFLPTQKNQLLQMSSSSSTPTTLAAATTTTPRATWADYKQAIQAAHKDDASLFSQLPSLGPLQMIDEMVKRGCWFRAGVMKTNAAELKLLHTIGKKGNKRGEFRFPSFVTQLQSGELAVTDTGNCRVQVFGGSDWRFHRAFGSRGTRDGQFDWPAGIAEASSGDLFVSDYSNNRIQRITASGEFVSSIGVGELSFPFGLAVSPDDDVVVADSNNRRLCIFRSDGQLVRAVTEASGVALRPADVCFTPNEEIVVADGENARVVWLRSDGTTIRSVGSKSSGDAQFQYAYGVASDAEGNVVVADGYHHRVQFFRGDGEFLSAFTPHSEAQPGGVCVLSDGSLDICDVRAHNVQIWG